MKPFRKKILVQLCQYIYKIKCVYSQNFLVFHLSIFLSFVEWMKVIPIVQWLLGSSEQMEVWWNGGVRSMAMVRRRGSQLEFILRGKKNPTMLDPFNFMLWSLVSHIITHRFRKPLFVWGVDCLCSRWLIRQESCLGNSIIQCRTKYMINVNLRVS